MTSKPQTSRGNRICRTAARSVVPPEVALMLGSIAAAIAVIWWAT
ncbi:hypothetical protein ACIBM3_22780 [Rhodococcus erythropolis]